MAVSQTGKLPQAVIYMNPGDVHTLIVDEGETMKTLFHNSGALLYCDEEGKTIGSTDVFDRVQTARNHFEEVGLAPTL